MVSHDGRSHEIVFDGAAAGHELSYAAFYADSQHEVRPVRSGYRLCLTYNLTLAKSLSKQHITAPSYRSTATKIAGLLRHWSKDTGPLRLAVTLEHRYSQESLTFDNLKGVDRARSEVLFEAAEQADCVAHLALVTLWQSGQPEIDDIDFSYGYGRRRSDHEYDDDDDDDVDSDEALTGYEMLEVDDWSLTVDHWSDRQGNPQSLGQMALHEDELVAKEPLQQAKPSREDFEGYTGNAGMTLERWYHRAAVIIWPRAKHFQVLCDAGTDASIGGFPVLARRFRRASKKNRDELRRECCLFATAIIDSWQPAYRSYEWPMRVKDRDAFSVSLYELDDPALLQRFLTKVLSIDGIVQLDNTFGKFAQKHGWPRFEKALTTVLKSSTAATIGRNAELLRILSTLRTRDSERIELCSRLCARMVKIVVALDKTSGKQVWPAPEVKRLELLQALVIALLTVGAEKPLASLIKHAWTSEEYDLTDVHLAAVFALERQFGKLATPSAAISKWLGHCQTELEKRVVKAPQKPLDYRRTVALKCKCRDCQALMEFLADPEKREVRLPMPKHRRQHMHNVIEQYDCDCTHVTDRRGRPHTLVCTKTTASYEAARNIFDRDLRNLARIVAMEKKLA